MRKDLKPNGIIPMPVLMIATYNEDGSVDVMNAAWGTMVENNIVALNLSKSHKTTKNIMEKKAFTVGFADARHVVEADYVGLESGNKVANKFEKSGLTATKSAHVEAPIINEFPVSLECEFIEYQDDKYGLGVIGKVVNVSADEKYLKDGALDLEACQFIAFDTYTSGYNIIGKRVGNAFKDGAKLK
jgi:flavin reductase (DIM6/NTAB) family NADH-FMN oxidoreductase RutF